MLLHNMPNKLGGWDGVNEIMEISFNNQLQWMRQSVIHFVAFPNRVRKLVEGMNRYKF